MQYPEQLRPVYREKPVEYALNDMVKLSVRKVYRPMALVLIQEPGFTPIEQTPRYELMLGLNAIGVYRGRIIVLMNCLPEPGHKGAL